METFRRVPRFMGEKRDKKAKEIRDSWLGKKYFFGPDSPATRDGRNLVSFAFDRTIDLPLVTRLIRSRPFNRRAVAGLKIKMAGDRGSSHSPFGFSAHEQKDAVLARAILCYFFVRDLFKQLCQHKEKTSDLEQYWKKR